MASPGGKTTVLTSDPSALRREAHNDAAVRAAEEEAAARRALAVMADQLLQPATVHTLEVHGARNTRRAFLDPIFQSLVDDSRNVGTTLGDVLAEVQTAVGKLERYDIVRPQPTLHVSDARARDPAAAATDLDVAIRVAELPRFRLNTGTDVGNTEGSAYGNLLWRNMFGGGETLSLNASAGTRTRSAYSAVLSVPPLPGSPDLRLSLEGLASTTQKPWASHEEVLRGGTVRLAWRAPMSGDTHTVALGSTWRQLTGLAGSGVAAATAAAGASPTVRTDAGDSLKTALSHTYLRDRRDNPLLPQRGYLVRTVSELAGWGPLAGDVAFAKAEAEVTAAVPLPLPHLKAVAQSPGSNSASSPVSIGAAFRAGLLYPLPFGYNPLGNGAASSRINDRFMLGGPSDVRGFAQSGLGPHDGSDAVGGDAYAAGSVNLLVPVTRAGRDSPLRLQVFANGGRLVALKSPSATTRSVAEGGAATATGWSSSQVVQSVTAAVRELATGLPSTAVGVGLVYAHPVARFEVNVGLPLVLRRGEESRKGVQVGVGINFM